MPEPMSGWRALLLRIGDKCVEYGGSVDYREHIDTCYSVLCREFEHYRDDILELLLQCAELLPHKVPFYGLLVGLINLEKEDFAKEIVDISHTKFQDAIDVGNCDRIRISLRFLICLMCSNVISPSSIIEIFETLLSSAATTVDEDAGNPCWQARADFYILCILSGLPWGGAELNEQVPDEFERVMVGIQSYLSIRRQSHDNFFWVFDTDSAPDRKDFLEDLWDRIQALSHNGWKIDSVPRPYLAFEAQLVDGKTYTLPPTNCSPQSIVSSTRSNISIEKEKHDAELKYPRRLRRLNIFPSDKFEGMQPVDHFVVEEYLLDVLLFFNGCRKECATYLVGLPVPFRYEYLMAETIFSQLLLLPQAPFKSLYYTLVIIDLCKSIENAPALEELLPPKGGPCFKYSSENHQEGGEGHKFSLELNNMVKGKKTTREIILWIAEVLIPAHGDLFASEVVIQTLLDIGSKSFTHLITVLERYGVVVAKLCSDIEMQVRVINEVASYWKNNTQMIAIAIDRMMGYRLISNLAIVSWVFSEANANDFHLSDRPWEILRNAVNKTYNRISDLRNEIRSLEKAILVAEEASMKAKQDYEAAESKLEVVDGQPVQAENPGRLKRLKGYAVRAKYDETSARESLEAKEALLVRALEENKTLFIMLYKSFKSVLMARLPPLSADGKLPKLSSKKEFVIMDLEVPTKMDLDHENGNNDTNITSDSERAANNIYNTGEKEQWCMITLGYLKAISRQYSTEIWPHMEVLDAEIFTEEIHPLFRKAAYDGLCRSTTE